MPLAQSQYAGTFRERELRVGDSGGCPKRASGCMSVNGNVAAVGFLFLKIGFCWFARQLFSRRKHGTPPVRPNDIHIQHPTTNVQQLATGNWSGVLFVVRLSITNFYCNLLLFQARSSQSLPCGHTLRSFQRRGTGMGMDLPLPLCQCLRQCQCLGLILRLTLPAIVVRPCFTFKYLILFSMK